MELRSKVLCQWYTDIKGNHICNMKYSHTMQSSILLLQPHAQPDLPTSGIAKLYSEVPKVALP